ncbi:MAG: hypothetical protein Aseana_31180 [Candidatus Pelagadaptatus aseana]
MGVAHKKYFHEICYLMGGVKDWLSSCEKYHGLNVDRSELKITRKQKKGKPMACQSTRELMVGSA